MTDELIFYTNPLSRGRIVRWMLEETGQPYQTRVLDYGASMKSPDYLAINPMGKVPAIRHGATIVTEAAAICAYLADAFPDAGLAPTMTERGSYYRWLFFAAGPVEAATMNKSLGVEVPLEKEVMMGYGSMTWVQNVLEQAVASSDYIGGPVFSAADVYVGSQVNWGLQFGTLEKRAVFQDYVARLTQRPAFQKAQALDDAIQPMS